MLGEEALKACGRQIFERRQGGAHAAQAEGLRQGRGGRAVDEGVGGDALVAERGQHPIDAAIQQLPVRNAALFAHVAELRLPARGLGHHLMLLIEPQHRVGIGQQQRVAQHAVEQRAGVVRTSSSASRNACRRICSRLLWRSQPM